VIVDVVVVVVGDVNGDEDEGSIGVHITSPTPTGRGRPDMTSITSAAGACWRA